MLIWRGIAPVRVEAGVHVEGPDVEREAIQALQKAIVRIYESGYFNSDLCSWGADRAVEAAGYDTARGEWRTEAGHG